MNFHIPDWREKEYTPEQIQAIYRLMGGGFTLLLIMIFGAVLFVGDHPLVHDTSGYFVSLFNNIIYFSITAFIINELSKYREMHRLKRRLIREAAGRSNERAKSAVDDLRWEKWYDALAGRALSHSHLQEANLSTMNLHGAALVHADLSGANLREANLSRTLMRGANLQNADLRKTNFQEADLNRAVLHGAIIVGTNFVGAIMPNGEIYSPGMDLNQFINPA